MKKLYAFLILIFTAVAIGAPVKITDLPAITNAQLGTEDVMPIVDITQDATKKISILEIDKRYAPLNLSNGNIFIGNVSGTATAKALSGDATIVASGDLTIANGAINNAKVASNAAIAYSKLNLSSSIVSSDISSSANIPYSVMSDLTASRAVVTNASGDPSASSVTATELGYVSGVTSSLQTQLNSKLNASFGIVGDVLSYTNQGSDPAAPSAGFINTYTKTAGLFYRTPSNIRQVANLDEAQTFSGLKTFTAGATVASSDITLNNARIIFPATPATCGTNTMCDYEQGTFTPTFYGASTAGTTTYTTQNGNYTKIGNLVCWSARITWTNATGTGASRFGGLPFTILSSLSTNCALNYFENYAITAANLPLCFPIANTTTGTFYQMPSGGGVIANVNVDTSADVIIGGCYQTSN